MKFSKKIILYFSFILLKILSKIEPKEENEKILRNDITPEFFKKDPYLAVRWYHPADQN